MGKPRVFIGSSVEGLNVAYAVQQNLLHEAEVTVWDQGVFELSRTTIESLSKALNDSDFAIFVFSPDDLARIRDQHTTVVRDNVLFEFGLFIGKLGRDRVFFLLPSVGDLHLPTDLLGVTPGRYESNRTDGSMQAGTGAVCHQIRQQMKSIGPVPGRLSVEVSTESGGPDKTVQRFWLADFLDGKYEIARKKLESESERQSGEDALVSKAWILYCNCKIKKTFSMDELLRLAETNFEYSRVQTCVAGILRYEGHFEKAIELLTAVKEKRPDDTKIALALAWTHTDGADNERAIAELLRVGPDNSPDVALELARVYEGEERKDEALEVIQRCYARNPSDKALRFKYARLAQDLNQHHMAIYLLDGLISDDEKSIEYWGYLGNSCIQLSLEDKALYAYRKAEKLMKVDDSSQWIVSNIGNLLINRGLPSEACAYLEQAVKFEKNSEYAHDRLASALKKKSAENKEYSKRIEEGKREVREVSSKILIPPVVNTDQQAVWAELITIPSAVN